jgi:hypothetical protein
MSIESAMLATLVVILGAAQYALCVQALRDLARRPRVRGENKVAWALGILCVPIAGAMLYNWMGPTSFVRRPPATGSGPLRLAPPPDDPGPENVTSLTAARAARRRRAPSASQAPRPQGPPRPPVPVSRSRRTGS